MRVIGPSFVDDVVGGATRSLRAVLGPGVTIYQIGSIHVAYLLGDMSEPELLTSIDAVRGGIGSSSSVKLRYR
jgi:hypothetical protein